MRLLLVKTSSLGDVVHSLPAVTDAMNRIPGLSVDWVVEEGFAEIPDWHPAVHRVIPVALRRWRKTLVKSLRGEEWRHFKEQLAEGDYDLVIDAQGLLKSAALTRYANAPVAGMDWHSAREPLASRFYQRRYRVEKDQHAIERVRSLFAQALGYPMPTTAPSGNLNFSKRQTKDVVFLHGTSRDDKCWPQEYWAELAARVCDAGSTVVLPWGSEAERQRAHYIADGLAGATVLPKTKLTPLAEILASAQAVVTVDTGLGHLAAAMGKQGIGLYGPTDTKLVGTLGGCEVHLRGNDHRMDAIAVNTVWRALEPMISTSSELAHD